MAEQLDKSPQSEPAMPGGCEGHGVAQVDGSLQAESTAPVINGGCAGVSALLATAARDECGLGESEQAHLSTCLRCRAEQVRYRRLMEAMRSLSELPAKRNQALESQILQCLAAQRQRQRLAGRVSSRVAAAAGGVAAGAAATAGLMALATRHRRVIRFALN